MNRFLLSAVFFFVGAAAAPGQSVVAGKVAETMDSGGYTYVRVSQGKDSVWVAMAKQAVKVGDDVSFTGNMMTDFHSKTQNRTFKKILFAEGIAKGGAAGHSGQPSHGPAAAAQLPVKVARAEGKDAYTVAEVYAKRAELAGKTVAVRGKVTKISLEIMDRNWVHLQDGSGDPKAATHDLLVTTSGTAKVGETVTARGTVAKDRDFGSGYKYVVLLEKAALKR
ncbi:MAG: DNA-binding protein [Elusimicrobiota bacterium]|nr:DNA-binding protein [Elusimicrobiota bacterium]